MSKIAITVGASSLDAEVEPRFGRSPLLLLVDPDTLAWEPLENPESDAIGMVGVHVTELLKERHVTDVVSGQFGPKACDALESAEITMHRYGPGTTVREAVEALKTG